MSFHVTGSTKGATSRHTVMSTPARRHTDRSGASTPPRDASLAAVSNRMASSAVCGMPQSTRCSRYPASRNQVSLTKITKRWNCTNRAEAIQLATPSSL